MNLIDDRQELAQRTDREQTKAALLQLSPPGPLSDVERAMYGANVELANGPAEVVLIALDDLALETVPHNVPGTSVERPNWQRRVPTWDVALIDELAPPAAAATVAAISAARPRD